MVRIIKTTENNVRWTKDNHDGLSLSAMVRGGCKGVPTMEYLELMIRGHLQKIRIYHLDCGVHPESWISNLDCVTTCTLATASVLGS
jgi:hypothetical protein